MPLVHPSQNINHESSITTEEEIGESIIDTLEFHAPKYKEMLKELSDPIITAKDIILPPYRDEPVPRNVPYYNT
jgi:hypothetical protein